MYQLGFSVNLTTIVSEIFVRNYYESTPAAYKYLIKCPGWHFIVFWFSFFILDFCNARILQNSDFCWMTIHDNIVRIFSSGAFTLLFMRFVNAGNEIDNADELRIHRHIGGAPQFRFAG